MILSPPIVMYLYGALFQDAIACYQECIAKATGIQ